MPHATRLLHQSDPSAQGSAAALPCPSASKHSIGFTHPKAAALHQIIKPEPAEQTSLGLHGDDGQCSFHGAGGPKTFLKKKWMADHMESVKKEEVAQQSSDGKVGSGRRKYGPSTLWECSPLLL